MRERVAERKNVYSEIHSEVYQVIAMYIIWNVGRFWPKEPYVKNLCKSHAWLFEDA